MGDTVDPKEKAKSRITTQQIFNMAPLQLSRKTGVIVGDDVLALFNHAQANNYAIPASQGGAAYFAGKGVDNKDQSASIQGAVAAAHYIPAVLHTDHCAKKLLP